MIKALGVKAPPDPLPIAFQQTALGIKPATNGSVGKSPPGRHLPVDVFHVHFSVRHDYMHERGNLVSYYRQYHWRLYEPWLDELRELLTDATLAEAGRSLSR
jgi:hypothetical protein